MQRNVTKAGSFIFLTEPFWVSVAASLVYLSVICDWPSSLPWIWLSFAFAPFLLRMIKYGYPGRYTPFDIPLAMLLASMIIGMIVSDHSDISLGAFQTFLAAVAFYYSWVNYPRPSYLIAVGLVSLLLGSMIALILAVKWAASDTSIPHGLGIVLIITGAVVTGLTVSIRPMIKKLIIGLAASVFIGTAIYFTHNSVYRLITLDSIESRMRIWLDVITPIEGSSLWTGLGLGCWPLTETANYGHVHNAYLELYINTGIVGIAAFFGFAVVGAKLAADILYSAKKNSLYYGFGTGVVLATLAILMFSFLESAHFGFGFFNAEKYHYILLPVPFILAGSLVITRRLLRER